MGYKGNNLGQKTKGGIAYTAAAAITAGASAQGSAIAAPWETGRQILFQFAVTAVGGGFSACTIKLQGRLRDTTTWENVEKNGADIEVDATFLAGLSSGDYFQGAIDLTRFPGETYDQMRLLISPVGGTLEITVVYLIGDVFETPVGQDDVFFRIQRYGVQ